MNFLHPPFLSRIFNVLLIGGLVLFLGCQSDPIVLNPPGGYEYISKTFQLDTENSYSIQGGAHTGHSPILYSGILNNGKTILTLIRLLPEVLESHQVCADTIDVKDVRLELLSTLPLSAAGSSSLDTTFIDTLLLKAYS